MDVYLYTSISTYYSMLEDSQQVGVGPPAGGDIIILLRCGIAINQPNELPFRIGACGGQIGSRKHARQDVPLADAADEEQHFACRCQGRKRQSHARNERFEAGFRDPYDPALLLVELGMTGKERRRVPVRAEPHQHDVEQWAPVREPSRAVKAAKVHLIQASGPLDVIGVRRYRVNVAGRDGNTIEQQPPRCAEIATRVVMRHETVVSPEPMDAVPGKLLAI